MSSAQWKNFQPPTQDNSVLAYQCSSSFNKSPNNNNQCNNNSSPPSGSNGGFREAGIIEKLLHSYGFIQCCERQARLFFHYSQYTGNIEHLKLGDPVEFEMTYDKRTGKPIASSVEKISSEGLCSDNLCEERVTGTIATEVKDNVEVPGRVQYENRGECFFLPYTRYDLESCDPPLRAGDKVTFYLVPDKQTGNLRAQSIRLEKPHPERFQGVVCALKDTFGFIERADIVKEIFFHCSECKDFQSLSPGDDVEFSIQIRNNKEVAVNITCLPSGTVVFEDINPERISGKILKPLDRLLSRQTSDPMPGKIQYLKEGQETEINFGERDPRKEFTFLVGDLVQFNVATDRRDQLQHATNIELQLDDTFNNATEKREKGSVMSLKDNFGFIRHSMKDLRIYFRKSELLNPDRSVEVDDLVEFSLAQDPSSSGRLQAIRVAVASSSGYGDGYGDNSVPRYKGTIEKEPNGSGKGGGRSSFNDNGDDEGIISYRVDGRDETIIYHIKECDGRNIPHVGDKVEFFISGSKSRVATEIKLLTRSVRNGYAFTHKGFVAALKDSFGFIETENHDREIFFHYSTFKEGNISNLEIGHEVEYSISQRGGKLSAECVRRIPMGTIPDEEALPEVYNGVVTRPVRCFNPDQEDYCGLVRLTIEGEDDIDNESKIYPFGITSLTDKNEFLQKGDVVQFQLGYGKGEYSSEKRALKIRAVRNRVKAMVKSIKDKYGFLCYEAEEGKELFFHMSEVKGGTVLQPGDKVEFVVLHNQKTGKYSACSVVRVDDEEYMPRPDRLVNRLRTLSLDDNGPRITIIMQPRGPDGTKGFNWSGLPSNMTNGSSQIVKDANSKVPDKLQPPLHEESAPFCT